MTTQDNVVEQDNLVRRLEDGSTVEEIVIHGRARDVDLDAGTAVFKWLGLDHKMSFPPELADDVVKWEGRVVEIWAHGTYSPDGYLGDIDLKSIEHFSDSTDEYLANLKPNPFDPETMPRASFKFDVHEFLRPIYEDRRRGRGECVCQDK